MSVPDCYRGTYLDGVRAVDFVCLLNDVDQNRIAVWGGSQVGGFAFASAALERTVRLCEMEPAQQIKSFSVISPVINALSFSPDGNLLVSGGGDFVRMGEVRMWRMQNVNRK